MNQEPYICYGSVKIPILILKPPTRPDEKYCMKHVSAKFLAFLFAGTAFLTGCDEPSVSVGVLGKKLSAPVLKSQSPFDQSFNSQGYVHLSGTCDNRVGDISLSFNATSNTTDVSKANEWHVPTSVPDVSGTSLPAVVNDVNCADGKFDFYLTRKDMLAVWNLDPDATDVDVKQILLKGSTLIGDTLSLVLNNKNNNGINNGGPVAGLRVEKMWPVGFAASGQCESFNVQLINASGYSTTASVETNFTLSMWAGAAGATGATSTVMGYTSWADCNASTNGGGTAPAPVANFVIPKSTNSIQVYFVLPSTTNYVSNGLNLQPASATLTSSTLHVTLRDPANNSSFIAFDPGTENRIHKNTCYTFTVSKYLYSDRQAATVATTTSLQMNPGSSKLKFYTDASCGIASTGNTGTIAAGASGFAGSFKYIPDGSETVDTLHIDIPFTAVAGLDLPPFFVDVDLTGSDTVSQVDFRGPIETRSDYCNPYTLALVNDRWTSLPAAATTQINLSSAAGHFYSDSGCNTQIAYSTVDAGQKYAYAYFKANSNLTAAGIYQISASITGLGEFTRSLKINLPDVTGLNLSYNSADLVVNNCAPFDLTALSDTAAIIPASTPITFNYTISGAYGSLAKVYSDNACTSELATGSVLNPFGIYTYRFYMKYTGAPANYIYLSPSFLDVHGVSHNMNSYPLTWQ